MMHSPWYVLVTISAACGIWLLWDLGFKRLGLDLFREEIFRLRFELFSLGSDGALPFSTETYQLLETLLNGLLRYGHRFTFLTYLFSMRDQLKARKEKDYVDLSAEINLKVAQAPQAAQIQLQSILRRAQTAVVLYISLTSLLFLPFMCVALILRLLRIINFSSRKIVGDVLEREAFRQMRKVHLVAA